MFLLISFASVASANFDDTYGHLKQNFDDAYGHLKQKEYIKASKEFKAGADEVKREIEDAASSVEDDNEN